MDGTFNASGYDQSGGKDKPGITAEDSYAAS